MRHVLGTLLAAAALGTMTHPAPADAQSKTLQDCIDQEIESCDNDFPGFTPHAVAMRGYCYMIRIALCKVLDR